MRIWVAVAGLAGSVLTLLAATGCERPAPAFAAPPPAKVTVAKPVSTEIVETLEYTGTTRGVTEREVRARVRGFVAAKQFEGGRRVKEGDVLYTIDQRPFQATVAQAKAELASRRAALKLAELDFKRRSDAIAGGAATQAEVDTAKANLDSAKAQEDLAIARLQQAELDLEYTTVKAPASGRVSVKTSEVGELVDVGALLCTVVEDSKIYASYNIDEAYILKLRGMNETRRPGEDGRPNLPVIMGLGSGTDYTFAGEVFRADNQFDSQTGTIRVDAVFDNPKGAIIPGMFCRVKALFGRKPVVLVPEVAVLSDQAGRYVLVVNEKNVVERRAVTVGTQVERLRQVINGVSEGDRVIVNGIQRARPGATVDPDEQPVQAPPPSTLPTAGFLPSTLPSPR
jgi:RND family efflux transporter MFP subunit